MSKIVFDDIRIYCARTITEYDVQDVRRRTVPEIFTFERDPQNRLQPALVPMRMPKDIWITDTPSATDSSPARRLRATESCGSST